MKGETQIVVSYIYDQSMGAKNRAPFLFLKIIEKYITRGEGMVANSKKIDDVIYYKRLLT